MTPYKFCQKLLPFQKLVKVGVLIIDDFLLTRTSELDQKHLLELFGLRNRSKSLILCSQMNTAEWHKKLGGGAIVDDRAISKSYHIFISGDSKRVD
ncbi:ATP-binding protein [Enterococcus gilvus]|uniref:ATP-binding protein n=1 Tax=Enterococcus gilvus TaxID=160453 RepID=UPI001DBCD602|nr:ATP-binding protein [Enterococcus gilvus]